VLIVVEPERQLTSLVTHINFIGRFVSEVYTNRGELTEIRVNSNDTHRCDASEQWYTTTCDLEV
jgi:hypothetical protein